MSAADLEAAKRTIIDIEENEIKPIKAKLTDLRSAQDEENLMEIVILKVRKVLKRRRWYRHDNLNETMFLRAQQALLKNAWTVKQ